MSAPAEWRGAAADVPPGHTAKLSVTHGGRVVEGFVVNHHGRYYAYVNRCPHVGTPLDLWPNEFLTEDGCALICSTHGAVFAPASGRCMAGPCVGDFLTPLAARHEGDGIVVTGEWECEPRGSARRAASSPRGESE